MRFVLYPIATSKALSLKAKAFARHGAKVLDALGPAVTHVLVGNNAKIEPQLFGPWKTLKVSWASDCIDEGKLLDATSYLIKDPFKTSESAETPVPRKRKDPPSPESPKLSSPTQLSSPRGSPAPRAKHENAFTTPPGPDLPSDESKRAKGTDSPEPLPGSEPESKHEPEPKRTKGKASSSVKPTPEPKPEPRGRKMSESTDRKEISEPKARSRSRSPGNAGNQTIIDVFHEMADERQSHGKQFSKLAYERAIHTLEEAKSPIRSASQARQLGLGPKLVQLVEDIVNGKIPENVREPMREKNRVLQLFQGIYSVGPTTAREFYSKGWRTLEDVAANVKEKRMLVSIEHYEDLKERISRHEVNQHYEIVKKALHSIDPDAVALCMGSYRRGQPDCGDIDIIVTKPGAGPKEVCDISFAVVEALEKMGVAKYTFGGGKKSMRWLGVTELPTVKKWRRMDILSVPDQELGASLIYYTGNDLFNRKLRWKASTMGLHLNEKGLFREVDDRKELVEGHDEKRIFELLNVPWREPNERIIWDNRAFGDPEPQPKTKPESKTKPEPKPKPEPKTKPEPPSKSDPETKTEPKPK